MDTEDLQEEATSEETTEELETTGETEETPEFSEYSFKHEGKDVTMSPDEFDRFYKAYSNEQAWEHKLHEKGRQLNQQRDELEQKTAQIKAIETDAKEWSDIRKQLQQNPEGRKLIAQLLNQSQPSTHPIIEEQQKEIQSLRKEFKEDKAIMELSKEIKDFDANKLEEFAGGFEFRNPKDMMLYSYYAWKGSQIDDLLAEERANVVRQAKKKKGLPPMGKPGKVPEKEYKNLEEMRQAALDAVASGETIF